MLSTGVRLFVVLALGLAGTAVSGQEVRLVNWFGGEAEEAGGQAGKDAGGVCDPASGRNFYFGAEAAVLTPQLGSLSAVGDTLMPEFDATVSPRLWLGVDNAEGLGIRATYWTLDADATDPAANITDISVRAQTLDFDVYQKGCWGPMEFQLSAGLRYGKLETTNTFFFFGPQMSGKFEGIGPTLALEGKRPFGSRNLSLVGGLRGSWLFGDSTFDDGVGSVFRATQHMVQVWNARFGIQWQRETAFGTFGAHALYEAQAWEWSPVESIMHQDIGFVGPTFGIMLVR